MTIIKTATAHQLSIFSFLDERDLHFAWRSCKALQRTAGDNRLWKLFLTKRSIEPTENNKQRLTTFFRTSCTFFVRKVPSGPVRVGIYSTVWDAVKSHLRSQKNHQLAIDADKQPRDVVVVSRGRWNESHSGFIDVYDMYAAIFNAIKSTPQFIAEKGLQDVARNSADPDKFRFLLDVGVNPSKQEFDEDVNPHGVSALDLLLRNRRCSSEAVKLLVSAKIGFSERRVSDSSDDTLPSTIEIAAWHCSAEVFCYLWSRHREVSQPSPDVDDTRDYSVTLANALCNDNLVKDDAVIKMLIAAGAKPDYNNRVWCPDRSIGVLEGCLDCALSHKSCATDTIRLLLDGGARPGQRTHHWIPDWTPFPGSLDVAVYAGHPKEVLELLLQHGATLSRAGHGKNWPGTLEFARIHGLPAESLQLLEAAAARSQLPPEEQAHSAQVQQAPGMPALQEATVREAVVPQEPLQDPLPQQAPGMPALQEGPVREVVVPQEPIQDPLPQVANLPEIQDQGREEPVADSPLRQILPEWLWNACVAIDGFIRTMVMRVVRFFSQNEQ